MSLCCNTAAYNFLVKKINKQITLVSFSFSSPPALECYPGQLGKNLPAELSIVLMVSCYHLIINLPLDIFKPSMQEQPRATQSPESHCSTSCVWGVGVGGFGPWAMTNDNYSCLLTSLDKIFQEI